MKRLSLALIALLVLSGCASVETEEATSQISSQSESESSSNQDDDQQQEALGYQEIIELIDCQQHRCLEIFKLNEAN